MCDEIEHGSPWDGAMKLDGLIEMEFSSELGEFGEELFEIRADDVESEARVEFE